MADNAKQQLVDLLEKRAFNPVLQAKDNNRSEVDKRKLDDVKQSTRSEIERFRNYRSAKDVVVNFRRDLDSEPAKKIHRELKSLGLPTINDVRDEFEKKVQELSVDA